MKYKILIPLKSGNIMNNINIIELVNIITECCDTDIIKLHPNSNIIEIPDIEWMEFETIEYLSEFGDVTIKRME